MIKQLRLKEAHQVVDAHARISHINILNLLGVCYADEGRTNNSRLFLMFESPGNSSLRNSLTRQGTSLSWQMRKNIAFDIAMGLHYLHHCIVPSYANATVSSADVFLTENWRAKLGNIAGNGITNDLSCDNTSKGGEKAGIFMIFMFGVVLLELISRKAMNNDNMVNKQELRDSIELLGGGASSNDVYNGGSFEQLREFIDPRLKDDYPMGEALCFAVLAKACVVDDPLRRPSRDDILKFLAVMV